MQKLSNLETYCRCFCEQERIFDDTNMRALIAKTEIERSFVNLSWDDYIRTACMGIKRYVLREDVVDASLDTERRAGDVRLRAAALSFR